MSAEVNAEDIVQALMKVGISEYEARVYLSLVLYGQLTARQISERTGVPYTRVYDIIKKLSERGWVEKVSENPLTFKAKPPTVVASIIRRIYEKKLMEIDKVLKGYLQLAYERRVRKAATVEIIYEEEELIRRLKKQIPLSRGLMMTICDLERFIEESLRIALKHGLKVSIIFNSATMEVGSIRGLLKRLKPSGRVVVRQVRGIAPLNVMIVAPWAVIMSFPLVKREAFRVFINEARIVTLTMEYFNAIWKRAVPFYLDEEE